MVSTSKNDNSLRSKLKLLTKPFHDSLEIVPLAVELASSTVSKERYINYLKTLYAIHSKFENLIQNMDEWSSYSINPQQRSRLHLLEKDLNALGASTEKISLEIDLHINWSFPVAVGVFYVLEGSTMGGQFLAQRLSHIKGNDALCATRYFQAYKDNTMTRWSEYCDFLVQYDTDNPEKNSEVILGACSMFLIMQKVMYETN
jgi:heme oxygenase